MSVYARSTYTVQRHLEGSILLKWVVWHVTFFFTCRAQDYTFCLLIVRYMLSDKIKGKSALKARTFLHELDKKSSCMFNIGLVSRERDCTVFAHESFVFVWFLRTSKHNVWVSQSILIQLLPMRTQNPNLSCAAAFVRQSRTFHSINAMCTFYRMHTFLN